MAFDDRLPFSFTCCRLLNEPDVRLLALKRLALKRIVLSWVVFLMLSPSAFPAQDVRVIGYQFPPFVKQADTGLTQALLKLLNEAQSDYHFSFHLTSPARRYRDLSSGIGDVIFFEMPEWEWREKNIPIDISRELLGGGEVYIALQKPQREQAYFDDITSKRIAAILNYHYGFAGFNSDRQWLENNFDIYLTSNHTTNIRILLAGRVDVAVVPEAFLQNYLKAKPELKDKIMVSDKRDQAYSLRALIRKGAPITVDWLERCLDKIKQTGHLKKLARDYGIERLLTY